VPGGPSLSDASPRGASATTADPPRWRGAGRTDRTGGLDPAGPQNGCAGVAWASPRFGSQLSRAAPANGACNDGRPPGPQPAACTSKVRSASNAARSTRGWECQPHRQAGQPVEHPGRQLQPAVEMRRATGAQHRPGRLLDHLMNANTAPGPGVPGVDDLALVAMLGLMGVPSPACTTASGRTAASAVGRRRSSPDAAPARGANRKRIQVICGRKAGSTSGAAKPWRSKHAGDGARGTARAPGRGPPLPPPHALTDKEAGCLDHLDGRHGRPPSPVRPVLDPIDDPRHQLRCPRRHARLPVPKAGETDACPVGCRKAGDPTRVPATAPKPCRARAHG
jgi:hypothetical protein